MYDRKSVLNVPNVAYQMYDLPHGGIMGGIGIALVFMHMCIYTCTYCSLESSGGVP